MAQTKTVAGSVPDLGTPSPFSNNNVNGIAITGDTLFVATPNAIYLSRLSQRPTTWTNITVTLPLTNLNVKGIAGEKGLEYYRECRVVNLGAQVAVAALVEHARVEKADAVLVSQVVTQRDAHLSNTREMSAAFREAVPAARRPLLVVGGPRFDELQTADLGVDRIFGRGTTPREVASYLVHAVGAR